MKSDANRIVLYLNRSLLVSLSLCVSLASISLLLTSKRSSANVFPHECPGIFGDPTCTYPCKRTPRRFAGYECAGGSIPFGPGVGFRGCCLYKIYRANCVKKGSVSDNIPQTSPVRMTPLNEDTECGSLYWGVLSEQHMDYACENHACHKVPRGQY